jgi:hypothetical protein
VTAAIALAVFLVPFVVAGNAAGLEIVHPLATVMLGDLISATLVSLLVLPALYARYAPDYDPADDLLHDLLGGLAPPVATAAQENWIHVNPDLVGPEESTRKRGQAPRPTAVDGASDDPSQPPAGAR